MGGPSLVVGILTQGEAIIEQISVGTCRETGSVNKTPTGPISPRTRCPYAPKKITRQGFDESNPDPKLLNCSSCSAVLLASTHIALRFNFACQCEAKASLWLVWLSCGFASAQGSYGEFRDLVQARGRFRHAVRAKKKIMRRIELQWRIGRRNPNRDDILTARKCRR